ncbi:MAG: histidine phosphatase family protein [Armatimonadetes bacterium]|nr:histidine phosphatase family protein [Armatimonadota bacterium]
MTRLYLVRHGDTYFEADRRIKGQLDVPLCPHGRRQAAAVAEYFRGASAAVVYCSTLSRTREGARLIAAATGAPVVPTPLIDEGGWGRWQGLTADEIARERAAGRADPAKFGPLGEARDAFATRTAWFLDGVAIAWRGRTVIAVTHGGVLKNAVLPAIGLTVRDRSAFAAETGSISLLRHDGTHWRPVFLNCTPQRAAEQHPPVRLAEEGV